MEYAATLNYVSGGAAGLGWHVTIGDHRYCRHMSAKQWGWNARAASSKYLAVEFAQATAAQEITDAQVDAFCGWYRDEVRSLYPDAVYTMRSHAEVEALGETGQRDGKTDVFPYGDPRMNQLRERILRRLKETGLVQ